MFKELIEKNANEGKYTDTLLVLNKLNEVILKQYNGEEYLTLQEISKQIDGTLEKIVDKMELLDFIFK